jgi:hypothetical protein
MKKFVNSISKEEEEEEEEGGLYSNSWSLDH